MKKIFYLLAFVLYISLLSCNRIKFDKPQPVSALSSIDIPKIYLGGIKDEMNKLYIYNDE